MLQTLLYGKLIKNGENQPLVRINDHKVIPLQFARKNNEPHSFSSDDVISINDMTDSEDDSIKSRINSLEDIVEAIWINEEKELEGPRDYAAKKSSLVGSMYKNDKEETIVNVTDSYTQGNRTWVEVEGNEQGPKQTEQDFVTENTVYNQPDPVNFQEVQDGNVDLGRGTTSSLAFANHGKTFTWTTISTPKSNLEVKDKFESLHQEVKRNFLKQFFAKIGDTTSDPHFDLKYASQMTLVDDAGNSKLFNKVLYYSISSDHYLELGKAMLESASNLEEEGVVSPQMLKLSEIFDESFAYASKVSKSVEENIISEGIKEEHIEAYRQIRRSGGGQNVAIAAVAALNLEMDNMGILPHADMLKLKGENVNYLTESDNARNSVEQRFKNDPAANSLISYHKHLVDLREKGSNMLQKQLAADENAVDIVTIGEVSAKGWKTDRLTKYKKDVFNNAEKFIEKMKKKDWKFSKPYFNVSAYSTGHGANKKTISSWAVDAHRIDPSITTPVLLWTDLYNAKYHSEMIKDLDDLDFAPTWEQVYDTKAYRFIAANTSFLTTPDGNSINDLIPDLNKHLFKHALYVEPVQTKGGVEVSTLIKNIKDALKLIKTDFDGPNKLAGALHQNAPVTIRNKRLVAVANQTMNQFKTSAVDIHQESIYLDTISLITSEEKAGPEDVSDSGFQKTKRNIDLSSEIYDSSKEGSSKNIKVSKDTEASFMTDEQYEALKDAQTKYFGSYRDAYKVRTFVAQQLIDNSSLNRDLTKPGASTSQMLDNTIREIENRKNKYEIGKDPEGKLITETLTSSSLLNVPVEYSITKDQTGVLQTLGDVSGENYNLLSMDDKWRYMSYVLGNPETKALSEIITSILPGILKDDYKGAQMDELIRQIYEDIEIEKRANLEMSESQRDEYAAEFQEGRDNIMDDLDKKNYQESIGALTNLFFNYTNLRRYFKNGKSENTKQMIDVKVAHKEIITAFSIANNPSESQIARKDTRDDRMQRVEEKFKRSCK